MRKWLLNKVNQVLTMCLSCMGLAGCLAEKYGVPMPAEYGCPYATFVAEGSVTNESDEPVEGVKVAVREEGMTAGEEYLVATTDAEGKYLIAEGDIFPTDSIWLYATDETGEYAPDSAKVKVTYDRTDAGHWYEGKGSAKANFVLKKKE